LHHPNASKLESFCLPLKSLHPIASKNASKIKGSLWHSKACTQLHNKMLQSSKLLFGTQKLAPNSNTKKNASKLKALVWHSKACTQFQHQKMLQSSKLLFSTQKLTPNCTTKCSKTQSFCLALKSLHPIAQQKCSKTQSFCLALKSLHPIIGNASKLKIQASNFFKMRQDPAQKKERKKKTPSKHKTQSLSS